MRNVCTDGLNDLDAKYDRNRARPQPGGLGESLAIPGPCPTTAMSCKDFYDCGTDRPAGGGYLSQCTTDQEVCPCSSDDLGGYGQVFLSTRPDGVPRPQVTSAIEAAHQSTLQPPSCVTARSRMLRETSTKSAATTITAAHRRPERIRSPSTSRQVESKPNQSRCSVCPLPMESSSDSP